MKSQFNALYESYMSELSAEKEFAEKTKRPTKQKYSYVCSDCRVPQVNAPSFAHEDGTKLCHDCAEHHGVLSDEERLASARTKDYSDGPSQDLGL